jgi:outer membrane protein
MIRNGLKAESDILEVSAAVASEELKKTKAQNDYEQALLQLRQLINLDKDESFTIVNKGIDQGNQILIELAVDSIYFLALNRLPEIQSYRAMVQASKINLAQVKSGYYPSLSFYAGMGTGYYQTRRDNAGQVIPFVNQLSNNASEYLGFSLGIPIFNNGRNISQTKLARIQLKESELTMLQEQQKLFQRISQDLNKMYAFRKEMQLGEIQVEALNAADISLQKKFEKGLAGQYEYSQAKNQLALARSELLSASLQYEITRRTIEYYQGIPIKGMQ